jgi:hypothetical protein
MPYAPTVNDNSGQILAQGMDKAFGSIADHLKQRKEEEKALKNKADIFRFILQKDPSAFGEGIDVNSLSPRQMANALDAYTQLAEVGSKFAFQKQVDLQGKRLEHEVAMAERRGETRDLGNGMFEYEGKLYQRNPQTGAVVPVSDVASYDREMRLADNPINWMPQQQVDNTSASGGGEVISPPVDIGTINPALQQRAVAAQQAQQQQASIASYLDTNLGALSPSDRKELSADMKKYRKLQDSMFNATSKVLVTANPSRAEQKFKQSRDELNSLDNKWGGLTQYLQSSGIDPLQYNKTAPAATKQQASSNIKSITPIE